MSIDEAWWWMSSLGEDLPWLIQTIWCCPQFLWWTGWYSNGPPISRIISEGALKWFPKVWWCLTINPGLDREKTAAEAARSAGRVAASQKVLPLHPIVQMIFHREVIFGSHWFAEVTFTAQFGCKSWSSSADGDGGPATTSSRFMAQVADLSPCWLMILEVETTVSRYPYP